MEAVKQDQGQVLYPHVLGRTQEGVEQDHAFGPEYATYRNAPWWEERLGSLLAGTKEGLDASSVEGGTACAFSAERVSGNTGRGGCHYKHHLHSHARWKAVSGK